MKKGDKAAIVCCSNGQAATSETTIKKTTKYIRTNWTYSGF